MSFISLNFGQSLTLLFLSDSALSVDPMRMSASSFRKETMARYWLKQPGYSSGRFFFFFSSYPIKQSL